MVMRRLLAVLLLASLPSLAHAQQQPPLPPSTQACNQELTQQLSAALSWHTMVLEVEAKLASLPPELQKQIREKLAPPKGAPAPAPQTPATEPPQ